MMKSKLPIFLFIGFIVFYMTLRATGAVYLSQFGSYISAATCSYYLNSKYTFSYHTYNHTLFRFFGLQIVLMLITGLILETLYIFTNADIKMLWILITGLSTILNYKLCKAYVFKGAL